MGASAATKPNFLAPSLVCDELLCDVDWIRRTTAPSTKAHPAKTLRIADIFCGCGGLSLGAMEGARVNNTALDIRLALDMSTPALEVYVNNLGHAVKSALDADVRKIFSGRIGTKASSVESSLAKVVGRIDLLVAGPPCQGHSDLNNRSRRNDPRNALYERVVRAVEILRPTAVLIENVPTVVHSKERVVSKAAIRLSQLGYFVSEASVYFSKLGLAQTRKRHCLLALKSKPIRIDEIISEYCTPPRSLRDYIWDIRNEFKTSSSIYDTPSKISALNLKRASYLLKHDLYDLPDALRPVCHRLKRHSYVSMYGRLAWGKPAQTVTSGFGSMGQGRYLHPDHPRTLTPHEAARLQGLPDFFRFESVTHRTMLQEMIGNAVPPRLSALFVDYLLKNRLVQIGD